MPTIESIRAREIIDSRGYPTVEADVVLAGTRGFGRASSPSGASVGKHEALELRDGGKRYGGYGVLHAISNIVNKISLSVVGRKFDGQFDFDNGLVELDGTENKARLGANATLPVSLAFAKACAAEKRIPLFQHMRELFDAYSAYVTHVSNIGSFSACPSHVYDKKVLCDEKDCLNRLNSLTPMVNVINGGKHADNALDVQEFMVVPLIGESITDRIRIVCELFYALRQELISRNLSVNVGDEGGFAPNLSSTEEALDIICTAINRAGYTTSDIALALDVAASLLYTGDNKYFIDGRSLSSKGLISYYEKLVTQYPIISLEDPMSEDDLIGWTNATASLSDRGIQVVGDDIFVTNAAKLQHGVGKSIADAIIIKPNQVGTLSEAITTVHIAHNNHYTTIVSHRSGETEDVSIAHMAVAFGSKYIKTGSVSRTDRVCKYNELLRIHECLTSGSAMMHEGIM